MEDRNQTWKITLHRRGYSAGNKELLRLGYFKFNIMASDDKFKATERSNIVGTYIGTQPR